jgi:hypothetical protein
LASKRDDWPSLVASSNFFLLLQKPPTPLSTPYLFTFCLQNIIKKKPTINPWENYYSRPSFTKSTSLPTTIVEKKKMNGVIYYLLMSFTAKKRRKNKAKSTKQTLSRLSQTGRTNFVCQQSSA